MEKGILFTIGPIAVNSAMMTMFGISLALVAVSFFATRNLRLRPGKVQNAVEKVVEMLWNFIESIAGKKEARANLPYLGSLFLFILLSNYSGLLPLAGILPGLAAPTSCLSLVAGLALCTFLRTHYIGIKRHGAGYINHFTKPVIFLLPLMILEEIVRPLSLTLRLFGNILGEESVTEQIFHLCPLGAPLVMNALSLIFGFVQAMVFTLLSAVYISMAASEGH